MQRTPGGQLDQRLAGEIGDGEEVAPALVADLAAGDAVSGHLFDEGVDIIAEQIEFVRAIFGCGVDGDLGRRQSKDQPAMSNIHVTQF